MPLNFIHGDITKIKADAIVNAANCSLLGGGGVDGAIHRAAGPELQEECITLHGCETGEAKMTKGYNLPSDHVIHTVGPVWRGGNSGEEKLLRACYRNSIKIATDNDFKSIAFPLISSGAYGYPKDKAIFVACDEISKCINDTDIEATLVFFDKPYPQENLEQMRKARWGVESVTELTTPNFFRIESAKLCDKISQNTGCKITQIEENKRKQKPARKCKKTDEYSSFQKQQTGLENLINSIDENFSEMLFRLIDEKGLTDPECYRKANISRKLFSIIKCNPDYKPEKKTVVAFAVALELTLNETDALLKKAGYAFSDCSKFDIIVCYYIGQKNYNVFEINETLFEYDQMLLGSTAI